MIIVLDIPRCPIDVCEVDMNNQMQNPFTLKSKKEKRL